MSCSSFRDGWPGSGSGDHAASCARCAEWAADQRRAAAALDHLRARLDAVGPSDREATLRAAFRDVRRRAAEPQRRRWPWALAATAACVVVATGLAVRGRTGRAIPARVAAAPSPARVPPAAQAEAAPKGFAAASPAPPTAPGPQPAAARPAAADVAPSAADALAPPPAADPAEALLTGPPEELGRGVPAKLVESAGGPGPYADDRFYPLAPGAEPSALESGQIVRVQLRPDVLEAVGLPARSPAGEPVEAEVLVGPDGVARGIRLAGPRR